jgi:hypothetical protein
MSSSGAGGEAGAVSDGDAGLDPDREPGRDPDPDPEPDPEPDPDAGADSGGGSDAGAEERFGGVKNSGVAGTRVAGEEGEAEAGAGRGTGAGSTGPTGVRAALASAALVSAKDWVPANSATRLTATTAYAWEARLLVRRLIPGVVHEF